MGGMIKGITVEIGGDTTKLTTALRGVNSTTKSLQSELRGVNSLLKMDPGNVTLLQQKQDLLTKSIANTEDKLSALKQAQKEVQEQFDKGEITEEQYRDFQREIVATEQKLESLKKEAENFGSVHAQQVAAAGEKMKDYGDKITDAGKTMSKVSGVIVGVGAAAVKTTADFDGAMSNVQAISGATGEQFEQLRDKAIEMGSKTKFSASESADALTYMAMAGWKTDDMLDGLEGVMNAAAATGSDLALTSDIITDGLTAFGMSAKDSSYFADVLTKTCNNANTNIEMLGETFKYAAPVCGTLGISLEDCSVAAGLMGNAGIKASNAGTAIRKGLLNLASPTDSVAAAMEQYNIKLIENADGSINLMETMKNMRTQLGGLSEAEQTAAISAIAGKNAVSGWAAVVNASEEDFNKLTAAVADSNGAAKEASEIQLDNLKGQITILKSTLEGIAIQIGDILMPIVRQIVAKIQEWTSKFSALDDGTKKIIVIIAGVVAAIGPLLLIIGKVMSSIGNILTVAPQIVKATTKIMGVVSKLGTFLAAHPAILIIGAIVAIVAALVALYKNCEPFREFVDNLWAKIKQFFIDVGEWFKGLGDKISQTWENVKTFFTETIPNTVNEFVEKIKNFFAENWKTLLLMIVNPFVGAFKLLYDNCEGFRNFINGFIEKIKLLFAEGVEKIKTFFTVTIPEAIQTMIQWFSELPYKIGYAIGTVLNTIKEFILSIWDFFTVKVPEYIGIMIEWFKGLPAKIQSAIVSAIDKIGDWCSKMKTKITTGVKNLIDSTVKFFKELPGKIKTAISNAITNIGQWCTDMKNKAETGIKNVATAVINGFKELPNKIKNVGKNIVEGLWNGITNMKNWVKNKVKGFADDILRGMKDALGNSESTVFIKSITSIDYIGRAVGQYGAVIKTVTAKIDGSRCYGNGLNNRPWIGDPDSTFYGFNTAIGKSGNIPIEITCTDSRGFTTVVSKSVNVLDYSDVQLDLCSVKRCEADGTLSDEGDNALVEIKGRVSATLDNTYKVVVKYKKTKDTDKLSWISTTEEGVNGEYDINIKLVLNDIVAVDSYNFEITVNDALSNRRTTYKLLLDSNNVDIDFYGKGTGIAFGGVAKEPGVADFYLPIRARKGFLPVEFNYDDFNKFVDEGTYVNGNGVYTGNMKNCPPNEGVSDEILVVNLANVTKNKNGTYAKKTVHQTLYRIPEDTDIGTRKATGCEMWIRTGYYGYYRSDEDADGYAWDAWLPLIKSGNRVLWEGGYYMTSSHRITLKEKISEQPSGICLVFSRYDVDNKKVMNANWKTHYIPKEMVELSMGGGHCIPIVGTYFSVLATKYLYIKDNLIAGHDDNTKTGTANGVTYANNKFVLRYVIGV